MEVAQEIIYENPEYCNRNTRQIPNSMNMQGRQRSSLAPTDGHTESQPSIQHNSGKCQIQCKDRSTSRKSWKMVGFAAIAIFIALVVSITAIILVVNRTQQLQQVIQKQSAAFETVASKIQMQNATQHIEKLEAKLLSTQQQLQQVLQNQTTSLKPEQTLWDSQWYTNVHQYKKTTTKQGWNESRIICQNMGGDLAVIGVQDLNMRRHLYKKLNLGINFWIGASDTQEEGDWKWIDGSDATNDSIHWDDNEPNSYEGNDEDCAVLWYNYKTNDLPCRFQIFALCERQPIVYSN